MSNTKNKCIVGMQGMSTNDKIQEAQKRQLALSQSPFNNIVPPPSQVSGTISQLAAAQQQCMSRNYTAIPQRDMLENRLMVELDLQCASINTLAQGDVDTLVLSGFPLQRAPSLRPLPAVGVMLYIKPGRVATEIETTAKALKNKTIYMFEVRQADGVVISHISQKAKTIIPGVAQNMDLEVRVCGGNARGMGMWSEYLKFTTPRVVVNPQNKSEGGNLKIA